MIEPTLFTNLITKLPHTTVLEIYKITILRPWWQRELGISYACCAFGFTSVANQGVT